MSTPAWSSSHLPDDDGLERDAALDPDADQDDDDDDQDGVNASLADLPPPATAGSVFPGAHTSDGVQLPQRLFRPPRTV